MRVAMRPQPRLAWGVQHWSCAQRRKLPSREHGLTKHMLSQPDTAGFAAGHGRVCRRAQRIQCGPGASF